ncbi:hypothetical protein NKW84_11320 [Acetobacter senegalensis]|nr:hypothetical protein [Acetobacter senegalensis]MCP1196447.1 hypothetical protein [Acetobacter senegalensis]
MASTGQVNAPFATMEQLGTKSIFQRLDLLAERGLCDVELFGRTGNVQGFTHREKDSQPA